MRAWRLRHCIVCVTAFGRRVGGDDTVADPLACANMQAAREAAYAHPEWMGMHVMQAAPLPVAPVGSVRC